MTACTGQPVEVSQTGLSRKVSLDRSAWTGQPGHRSAWTQVSLDISQRTGRFGQARVDMTTRTWQHG
jgi:hypothetical protein